MPQLVLLTGASGFLGAHIAHILLESSYNVRLTVRSPKEALIRAQYAAFKERAEVVVVDDIAADDLTTAIKGVDAVIHVASPLSSMGDAKSALDAAVRGSSNIVGQAAKAGVKKVVVTSSLAALCGLEKMMAPNGQVLSDKDWFEVTEEEVLAQGENPALTYFASKSLAEQAVWKVAAQYPEIDVTTILPSYLFGPFAPGAQIAQGNPTAMSTNGYVYMLIAGEAGRDFPAALPVGPFVDVRDAARAHVQALSAPPASALGQKRIIISSGCFSWKEAIEHLQTARPALSERLPNTSSAQASMKSELKLDLTKAKEVLGMETFIGWEKTIDETIDSLFGVEEGWKLQA